MIIETQESTLSRWYEWLWRHLGFSKPITEECRAFYHNYPLLTILLVGVIGCVMGHYMGWWNILITSGWVFLGIVLGHFFWGTAHTRELTFMRRGRPGKVQDCGRVRD